MKPRWLCVLGLLVCAACGQGQLNSVTFEGTRFSGDLRADRADRATFVARGGPASVSLAGARQAALYQAVQHCIAYIGSSEITWAVGPDAADDQIPIEEDRALLSGRCAAR